MKHRIYYGYIAIFLLLFAACKKQKIEADILIKNGTVYTGEDSLPKAFNIAIKDDKISYIGRADGVEIIASKTIDAKGLVVSPGFIDPHTHATTDLSNPELSDNKPFLYQGVTTVTVGNDGNSPYPLIKYREKCEGHGVGTNVVLLVGHGTIRRMAIGNTDRKATSAEIEKMQNLIQVEMDAGAFGMSTGLFYAPGSYSDTEEIIALAKIVAQNNGIYDTHMRDESTYSIGLVPAVQETIEIGEKANLPVHISHIKCLGVEVWKQSDSIIDIIETAQKNGVDITANQYPYEASATGLQSAVVPRWAESGGKDSLFVRYQNPKYKEQILKETRKNIGRRGGPETLLVVQSPNPDFVGKTLLEISEALNMKPEETVYKVLEAGYIKIASFNMTPYDIANFMDEPWVVTGSDGGSGHPRKYGTFPKKYHKYVKKDSVLDLGAFINQSTSVTAEILRIPDRGKLKKDYFADIIIFDPETFQDKATYNDPFQLAQGVKYSIINGKISIDEGEYTGERNGVVLKK
ncbi:MAG: amidohydrolase [Muricauda sp.]|nr:MULTISPECIES: amidohydrolase family protein [unclassified Allomuricauda]MAU15904.1 amidohydrolase [Allomuricauda sp.]|tara:strand:- start:9479 stop:11035 length:1557 start_codon:yes stop_codon:yes gene_type:complete